MRILASNKIRLSVLLLGTVAAGCGPDYNRFWHPWLRVERLIRSILEVRRDEVTRPVLKATLTKALRERENIRRDGWMN